METNQLNLTGKVVYVVDGARTPFLKFKGVPGPLSAADLGVAAARPLLARQPFAPNALDQVIAGCVMPSAEEVNIARLMALRLGCGDQMPAFTVQRNCASGLQAIDSARQWISEGRAQLVLAGGTEAMSRAPLLFSTKMVEWLAQLQQAKSLPHKLKTLTRFRPSYLAPVVALLKGLTDPYVNLNMGQTAEELSYHFGISRQEMDQYALESHLRCARAQEAGELDEIEPIYAWDGRFYSQDDGIRVHSTLEKLGQLKPAFEKYGKITAGNSSQISDGAAWLLLASEEAVEKYQLPVLGKIVDCHWAGLAPTMMGLGPIHAMTALLKKFQLSLTNIDHFEINEAFAAQVLACLKAWDDTTYCREQLHCEDKMGLLEQAQINSDGGAIALGHPVGASGARVVLHALKRLNRHQGQRALASLCIGGGQGGAILVERT